VLVHKRYAAAAFNVSFERIERLVAQPRADPVRLLEARS
jgi:hypothetical protein